MANAMQFELASPLKQVYKKPVAMVTVPGSEGSYGVLAGHAPMATGIAAGVLEVYENDQNTVTDRWFVIGGFCEVTTDRCTVMADQIIAIKDLNRDAIEAEIKSLSGDNDEAAAEKLAIAQAKLLALG
ncbi:MAG TPA: ATP synthase F1 subunit epsilon [Rhodospirillaceae bacterium]|nr:ATP synthase F1 subunit epsilon [Rhodospirillaceae bacterium]